MTPEIHAKSTQLESQHRQLVQELKLWQTQVEAPSAVFPPQIVNQSSATQVPIDLWLALKNGMCKFLQARIEANRKNFEEL